MYCGDVSGGVMKGVFGVSVVSIVGFFMHGE